MKPRAVETMSPPRAPPASALPTAPQTATITISTINPGSVSVIRISLLHRRAQNTASDLDLEDAICDVARTAPMIGLPPGCTQFEHWGRGRAGGWCINRILLEQIEAQL